MYDCLMSLPAEVVLRHQDIDALEREASVVAAQLNLAHARLVDLTGRLLEGDRWAGEGIRSAEHWLMVHAGLSPTRAGDVVRLASRAPGLPTTMTALAEGQMSMDQAAVVAKYAPASHEQSIGQFARLTTVPQLRRTLSRYQFGTETGGSQDPAGRDGEGYASAAPQLSMSYGDGRFFLRFDSPADVGALVEQAVKEAKVALFTAGNAKATYADGLVEVARRSLSSAGSEGSRRSHYRVYVHLSTDGAWVGGKGGIPASLADKYACDGVVQPVWETDGKPVSVGRAQRIVPDRTRRLVQDRDRGCVFPGCTASRFLEVHHLDPWSEGGSTDMERQVCVCPWHHDAYHRGEYTITGSPGALVFVNSGGLRIAPAPAAPASPATCGSPDERGGQDEAGGAVQPYAGPTGERLDTRWVDFAPNRPSLAVVPDDTS
jgi:Domain of unknown function (DUF222)